MVSEKEVEAFLEHYGVKGMKWGVRRSARKDVKTLRKIHKKGGKGSRARYADQKQKMESRSANDPKYARNVRKQKRYQADPIVNTAVKAQLVVAGAAFIAMHPATKKTLVATARAAGNIYGRMGESEANRIIRRNAYVPRAGAAVYDVYSRRGGSVIDYAGALTR